MDHYENWMLPVLLLTIVEDLLIYGRKLFIILGYFIELFFIYCIWQF